MSRNIYIFLFLIIHFSLFQIYKSDNHTSTNSSEINHNGEEGNIINKLNYTNVLYLEDTNYTKALNKSDLTFLLFHSLNENSQKFMPIFIETADYCKKMNKNYLFARIDIEASPNVTLEYDVYYEPTVFLIKKGRPYKYDGDLTKRGLLKFSKKIIDGDFIKINKLEELEEYIKENSTLVFLSTIKNESSILYKSYLELSRRTSKQDFLSCISEECHKKYGEDLILFKSFDEKMNSYTRDYGEISKANYNSLDDFISIFGIEYGSFLDVKKISLLTKYEKEALIYMRRGFIKEHTKYDKLIKELGLELRKENLYTFISDIDEKGETNIDVAFSVVRDELPCVFYYNQNSGDPIAVVKLFSIRNLNVENLSIEYLKKFISDARTGKIKRDLFSEPISKSRMIDGMKYVIGKTFDEDVIDEKKNVFLGLVESDRFKVEDIFFLNILKNLTQEYKDIKFAYININKNEPRDLPVRDEIYPFGYLYTNAMKEKRIIKFTPINGTEINEKVIKDFLDKNMKEINEEEKKNEETPKKENAQTDL